MKNSSVHSLLLDISSKVIMVSEPALLSWFFFTMPSSTQSSKLQLPSSTPNLASLQSLKDALPIKLDRNNYILWKTRMENVFFTNGFEEFIGRTKPCPSKELPTGDINPEFVQWRHFDRMVLSWLYSTLTLDIMSQIVGHQTSHDAWMALQRIFFASSKARIMQLRLEFQTTKKWADSMLEYILYIKTISNNLAAIGEPIKNKDHILQLHGGLGPKYNSIVASLTTWEDNFSLHFVHNILLTHEQRLNHQHTPPTDLHSIAHMAAIPNSIPPQAFSNSHSWHHLRPPHQIKNQHQTPRNQHQGPPTPNRNPNRPSAHPRPPHLPTRPQCQLCGKFGHTTMKCYHRFDITYQDNNGASSSRDSSQFQAMLAAALEHQDSWFFDTGATHHLTHSAQTLSHVQSYFGAEQVTIGDG